MNVSGSTSVIIPVLNGAETIAQTLGALASQADVPAQTEIIVVDNGSTDNTREIVKQFNVTLLVEKTRGPSAARNSGLQAATGKVIVYLDADTLPTRNWLAELTAAFEDPDVVIAGGRVLGFPPRTAAQRYMTAHGIWEPDNNIFRPVFPFVPSLNLAVRRDAALTIGGWAEDMLTGEDVDFSYRILNRFPTTIAYRPRAILFHHHRKTDDELRTQAWTYGEGGAQMYRRYPGAVNWDFAKTLHVCKLLTLRGMAPSVYALGHLLRLTSAKRVELASYHRLWTWWWWRGFLSMYRNGERRMRAAH
jgi:glycosyltransferase involved in cell wall biosynthesis